MTESNENSRIARLEERVAAQQERIDRTESVIERSVQLARTELERRLDILNHAHENALQDRTQFVTRAEMRWLIGTVVVLLIFVLGYVLTGRPR